jgi:hypothetical protein
MLKDSILYSSGLHASLMKRYCSNFIDIEENLLPVVIGLIKKNSNALDYYIENINSTDKTLQLQAIEQLSIISGLNFEYDKKKWELWLVFWKTVEMNDVNELIKTNPSLFGRGGMKDGLYKIDPSSILNSIANSNE